MQNLFPKVLTTIFIVACLIFSGCDGNNSFVQSKAIRESEEYVNRGLYFWDKDDYEKAIEYYTKAIEINPNNYRAYDLRGYCYDRLKNYELELKDLDKAIEIASKESDPDIAYSAYNNRGQFYAQQEKYDLAIQDYTKSIEICPDYFIGYIARGNCYEKIGETEKAIQDYTELIRLFPNDTEAYNKRGAIYYNQQKYDKAVQDFNEAIKINSKSKYSQEAKEYYNRGLCYQKLGDEEKAQADFAKAKELGYEE